MAIKNSIFVPNAAPSCDSVFLNSIRSEINNLITNTGQTITDANLNQLGIAAAIMSAGSTFYTDSGIADAYVLSGVGFKSVPNLYFTGMQVRFFPGASNTGACTVNVNDMGVKNIKARDGTSTPAALAITAGRESWLTFNGTNFVIAI